MSLARGAHVAHHPPATPQTPHTPQTPNGSWRHPQFDEIAKRQYATTFDHTNLRAIVRSTAMLVLSYYLGTAFAVVSWALNGLLWHTLSVVLVPADRPLEPLTSAIYRITAYADPLVYWGALAIRAVLVALVFFNLWPLLRRYRPDNIADIPLTPSQRAALGLKSTVPAQTPGSAYASPNYVTPPRYARSTPRTSSFSSHDQSASPLARSTSASPFSPAQSFGVSTSSPLFQRAINTSSASRSSHGAGDLGSSLFSGSESSGPGTPTPVMGKASVGLNNKWLYEKRRDSPRSSLFA
ncbi:hypothetical protein NX059_009953 [Plenodomus lindquistii]|nr:hypothetical protein NX059_009953 [Plenodomus lindquistii]